jgi:hypothetical protein
MIPMAKCYKLCILGAVIGLLLAGCAPLEEKDQKAVQTSDQLSGVESEVKPSKQVEEKPAKKDLTVSSPAQPDPEHDDNQQNAKVIQTDEDKIDDKTKPEQNYNVTDPYDASDPTLMGFTITDPINDVIKRFGKPSHETVMNDGVEPLQIFEYPGFVFGFNSSGQIVFIEVHSDQVNPGLNELHVGQNVEAAQKSLGSPDSLNEYVMIYSNENLIMKLDLDPNSGIIRSIKLFAE